jgi:glycosyltransferase involved in cell wall biosynthesis
LSSLAVGGAARLCHLHFPPEAATLRWAFRRRPHLVVACSEAVCRQMAAVLGPEETPASVTIPNAIDRAHWSESADGDRSPALPEHDALILFCGSLSARKGIEDFLQLAARVVPTRPRALFVIAGEDLTGSGAYRRRMEELAATMGLGDRVLFTGFVGDPRALVQAATMVVLPSSSEGMPLALLEAAASAKPVIAYRIPGVDEVVNDGIDGRLVPLGDVGALTAATRELLGDPTLATEMGRRGRRRVEASHDADDFARRIAGHYEALLRGTGAAQETARG